jgi:shikimate dehydrogenase
MHNAALREMGLDGVYVAFDVPPPGLADAVRGLQAAGVRGINCTIPHKEALIPLMDELDEDAEFIGAVNTIVFREGRRHGHNTDAPGFIAALHAEGFDPAGKRALVLGAGGSARAVVTALARVGARVALANRTAERAEELAERVNRGVGAERVTACSMSGEALAEVLRETDLLVNTTSLGMSPHEEAAPPVPPEALGPGLFVYDLIYNPLETRLLKEARARGARGAHGAGMLARQGALALELWTGREAPARLMEETVLRGLRGA